MFTRNPLHVSHDLTTGMSEGEMRSLAYDLRDLRHLDEAEARALAHLVEDLYQLKTRLEQRLADAGVTA